MHQVRIYGYIGGISAPGADKNKLCATQKKLLFMSKRIFGIVFISLAAILTLAIVGQLPTLFGVLFSFFAIFTGKLDAYQVGKTMGNVIYWVIHFVLTILFWRYGVRWSRKPVKAAQ